MTSLQNLLCKKDKVLCLLTESATRAHEGVQELVKACNDPAAVVPAENVLFCRVAERRITEEIREELYSTPTPALHSVELENLSEALYKIPKIANKFREQFAASPEFVRKVDFSCQLSLAEQASELLVRMVKSLQGQLDLQQAEAVYEQLQSIEQEGDRRLLGLYRDLYGGRYPADQVFLLKELFELLEKLIDRTKRAGRLTFVLIRSNC